MIKRNVSLRISKRRFKRKEAFNPKETLTTINNRYEIQTFSCDEDDVITLRTVMEKKMAAHPDWKGTWLDDHLLRRFLCSFPTVQESEKKLCRYFNWRHEENIDGIDVNDPIMQELLARSPNEILDQFEDRFGRPIMITHTARQTKEANRKEQLYKRAMLHLERMCAKSDEVTPLRSFVIVFNMKNSVLGQTDQGFLQRYVIALRDFYPERVGVALVVNYRPMVRTLWKLLNIFMSKQLRSKFIFCTKDEFNDFVDVDKMPVKLFD